MVPHEGIPAQGDRPPVRLPDPDPDSVRRPAHGRRRPREQYRDTAHDLDRGGGARGAAPPHAAPVLPDHAAVLRSPRPQGRVRPRNARGVAPAGLIPSDSLRAALDAVFRSPAYDWAAEPRGPELLRQWWLRLHHWLEALRQGHPTLFLAMV